jgi:hypothetical protein
VVKDTQYTATIVGIRPLLMHNGRLADPLDEHAKALKVVTSKKKKTDDDHIEIGRVEFVGGLYFDEELGPYIPADNLQTLIEKGAQKRKMGPLFKALVEVPPPDEADGYALSYEGPRTMPGLWNDKKFVLRKGCRVSSSRVIRTRARFPTGWKLTFPVFVLDKGPTKEQVHDAIADAGILLGLGDYRPRYGRFEVESLRA